MTSTTPPLPGRRHPVTPARRTGAVSRRTDLIASVLLLAMWLAVVIFTTTRHEYWRDEVRPWSLARAAHSPLDLLHRIRYEGHPILWYLILYVGHLIVDSPVVLPIASVTIAAAAMALFMLRSPFPLWLKALFLFCSLPLYHYSVMARNYGISMLLLFLAASLYRHRTSQWLPLAVALALLANTNIHATMLAFLLMVVWTWDELSRRGLAVDRGLGARLLLAAGIVGLGILLSVIVVRPPRDTVLTHFYSTTPKAFASAFGGALVYPRAGFRSLFVSFVPWPLGQAILYLSILGLLRRPLFFLAAVAGLVALGVLFRVGSPGAYRHAGVYLCFLVSLYWMAADDPGAASGAKPALRLAEVVGYGGLVALILPSVYGSRIVRIDITAQMSSSKALGAFLNATPSLRDAILVPEPDYYIESLPYYAPNPIYLAREHRFGNTVTWSSANAARLSLGQLVSQAQQLKVRYRRPVLVVLGHPSVLTEPSGESEMFYGKSFAWTTREREDAERSLERVAEFWDAASDENYWVYAVR